MLPYTLIRLKWNILYAIWCHVLGEYTLQPARLQMNKRYGVNLAFAAAMLYILPFVYSFGADWRAIWLFAIHMILNLTTNKYYEYIEYAALTVYIF